MRQTPGGRGTHSQAGRKAISRLLVTLIAAGALSGATAGAATADQSSALLASGLTQVAGALADPIGRVWVSDRVEGFCRMTDPTPSVPGGIETSTCIGGASITAGEGPVRAGVPAFIDPTSGSVGSGDEMALIPDYAAGSAEVTRVEWNALTHTFEFHSKLTLHDGDLRPKAVSVGDDRDAYVIFERTHLVLRIVDPTATQPDVETVADLRSPAPLAIAAAGAEPGGGGNITVYVAEKTGLTSFVASDVGTLSAEAPYPSYDVGLTSALQYDTQTNVLYSGTATAMTAGQDVVKRVTIDSGQIESQWSTGYSRIGGLGLLNGQLVVADDVGLLSATDPTGTGSLHLLGQATIRILSGPTLADGTPAPDPAITNDSTPTFTVASEPSGPLECALYAAGGSPVWTDCSTGTYTPSALSDANYTFAVRSGSTGIPVPRVFTVDTIAPVAPIIGAPAEGQVVGGQLHLDALAENGSTLFCATDSTANSDYKACASGDTLTFTTEGSHVLSMKAVDRAGNVSPVSQVGFVVDLAAPELSITSPSADGATLSAAPSFEFSSSSIDVAGFQCRLDAQAFAPCTSPQGYTAVVGGTHTFEVAATDVVGNQTVRSRVFMVADTTAPVVTALPVGGQYPAGQKITLSANETANIYYTTDGTTPTTASTKYTGPLTLSVGFTLKLIGVDTAGNASAPATQTYTVAAVVAPSAHDFNGDGRSDVLARDSAGALWLYPGDGSGGWSTQTQVGWGWNVMTAILTPGDFTGDGRADVLARDSAGALWLYPGDGSGGWLARTQVGWGWNVMTAILSPGDFTGDGRADVLARDSAGALWLYPGNGSGGWLAPSQVGSGWNVMTAILSPGDFTGDGRADVLARDSAGMLWLYPGNGSGGLLARKQVSSGWNVMTAIA